VNVRRPDSVSCNSSAGSSVSSNAPRMLICLLAAILGFLVAAPAQAQQAQPSQPVAQSQPAKPLHIVRMKDNSSPVNTSAPAGAHLSYYGGPVISNVHVVVVYWGTGVYATAQSDLPGF
jgi:hypothetical protein